jgi:hypothetical protein
MPLLAGLIGSIATALVGFFARFLSFKLALKFASYTTWLAVFGAFLISVYVCLSSLYGMVSGLLSGSNGSGISWVSMFFMGVGMFIPANAGAVVACVGSVWIATGIYKIQKDGIQNYSK